MLPKIKQIRLQASRDSLGLSCLLSHLPTGIVYVYFLEAFLAMTQALMTLLSVSFFLSPLHIGSVSGESDPCATRNPEGKIVISPSAVIKVAQLIIRNHMPHDSFFLYRFCYLQSVVWHNVARYTVQLRCSGGGQSWFQRRIY